MPKRTLLLIIILSQSFAARADDLLDAVNAGDVEAVDAALVVETSAGARNAALKAAVIARRVDLVERFVAAGAEIDHLDGDGVSPLFWTIGFGNEPAALAFIEAGAKTDTVHPRGFTMLDVARSLGLDRVQKAIEERG